MKHFARVVRPRFEVTYVEVDLPDGAQARQVSDAVLEELIYADPEWELREFDPINYEPFVELAMSDFDMEAEGDTPEEGRAWMKSSDGLEFDRYLFLHADIGMGEGRVMSQPWIDECYAILVDDLAEDWGAQLKRLVLGPEVMPESATNVVPLRRPSSDDDQS